MRLAVARVGHGVPQSYDHMDIEVRCDLVERGVCGQARLRSGISSTRVTFPLSARRPTRSVYEARRHEWVVLPVAAER